MTGSVSDTGSRLALVTGSARGIGSACASLLASDGYTVIGIDVLEPVLPAGLDDGSHFAIHGDVSSDETWQRARTALRSIDGSLFVLINNAALQLESPLLETSVADFVRLHEVNVLGPFLGLRLAAECMAPGGAVVNLASVLSFTADPLLGAYCVTKGAVANMTRAAALELAAKRIRVNAVCPGAVRTELTTRVWAASGDPVAARKETERLYPRGTISEPAEIAAVVAFLAGAQSVAMTGALVTIDGGLTAANAEYGMSVQFMTASRTTEQRSGNGTR